MSDEKPMGQVIQMDEARIRDHLGEMVRGTVEETLNALLGGGSALRCKALRAHSRPAGHPGRQLRTLAAHSWRSKPQGSEASAPDLRDGHHRALPPARELGRG